MDLIRLELTERGLKNLDSAGAEDLRAIKTVKMEKYEAEYPLWYADYADGTLDTWVAKFKGFRAAVADPVLAGRDDIALLGQYLELRDQVTQVLSERGRAGKAATINATANTELRLIWEARVENMLENPTFSDIYDRWLEHAPMDKGTWPQSQRKI